MKRLKLLWIILILLTPFIASAWPIYNTGEDGGEDITLGAADNMSIDAATTPHTGTDGVIDITLTPAAPSTRGTQVTIDANGQNDTMGHNITYSANGLDAGDIGMAIEVNVDKGTSTGGEVDGLRVTKTGIGGVEVSAIHAGTRVDVIHHDSGTPISSDNAFLNTSGVFINATTAFRNDSSTLNYILVPNLNDYIYIGHTSIFTDVEVLLDTVADTSIIPVFEYYTGGWKVFGPNDSTTGLTTNGLWSWEAFADWVTTTVNGVSGQYWIRAKRTETAITTDAIEQIISIIVPTEYSWNADGEIVVKAMLGGINSSATGISSTVLGGKDNTTDANYAVIAGGIENNSDGGNISNISGGKNNIASAAYVAIGGGLSNTVSGTFSVVGGGHFNSITNEVSTIGGGRNGSVTGFASTIGGGELNTVTPSYATVSGGISNTIASGAEYSAISGGELNTVSAPYGFTFGRSNSLSGDYNTVFGRHGTLSITADRSSGFIYGPSAVTVTAPDVHVIYGAAGTEKKVGIQHLAPDDTLDIIGTAQITGNVALDSNVTIGGNLTVTGASTVKSHAAYLSYEDETGFFEDYSTADIYYKWQNNISDAVSFGNMSASASDGSITILAGGDGIYQISRNTGIHGEPAVGYSFAIFSNETAISESHTSPGVPSESFPFFTNLSSYGGDATYGVNSTIPFLLYPDKDQIDIIEGGTGNGASQWCFEYDMHFKVKHVPHFLSLGNIQYNGGAGHFADAMAFDNWSSEWDDLRIATGDIIDAGNLEDYKNENIAFAFPDDGNEERYILDGIVKTRLRHNDSVVCSSGHTLWIDYASITDKVGARSDSSYIIRELVAGDKITVREMPNTANKFFHRHKTILNISRLGDS